MKSIPSSSFFRPRFAGIGLLCLGLAGAAAASGTAAAPDKAASSATTAAGLYPAITALIGDAACDSQAQCHSVGVGAKACGGPNAYMAWSSKSTDPVALRAAIESHAQSQRLEQERAGMASNCMVTVNPGAVCRPRATDAKQVCQLGQGGAGRAD